MQIVYLTLHNYSVLKAFFMCMAYHAEMMGTCYDLNTACTQLWKLFVYWLQVFNSQSLARSLSLSHLVFGDGRQLFGVRQRWAPMLHSWEVVLEGALWPVHTKASIAWITLPVISHPLWVSEYVCVWVCVCVCLEKLEFLITRISYGMRWRS